MTVFYKYENPHSRAISSFRDFVLDFGKIKNSQQAQDAKKKKMKDINIAYPLAFREVVFEDVESYVDSIKTLRYYLKEVAGQLMTEQFQQKYSVNIREIFETILEGLCEAVAMSEESRQQFLDYVIQYKEKEFFPMYLEFLEKMSLDKKKKAMQKDLLEDAEGSDDDTQKDEALIVSESHSDEDDGALIIPRQPISARSPSLTADGLLSWFNSQTKPTLEEQPGKRQKMTDESENYCVETLSPP